MGSGTVQQCLGGDISVIETRERTRTSRNRSELRLVRSRSLVLSWFVGGGLLVAYGVVGPRLADMAPSWAGWAAPVSWEFWTYWSWAALGLTAIYTGLFFLDAYTPWFGRPAIFRGIGFELQGLLVVCIIALLGVFALGFFWIHDVEKKLWVLMLLFAVWCVIDVAIAWKHKTRGVRKEFFEILWQADVPYLFSFGVMYLYFWWHFLGRTDEPRVVAFFNGAIAFKMLVQNMGFIATQIRR